MGSFEGESFSYVRVRCDGDYSFEIDFLKFSGNVFEDEVDDDG